MFRKRAVTLSVLIPAIFVGGVHAQDAGASLIFGRDVAPVLIANCLECHDAARKSSGFSMATFASLQAGGDSGAVWAASNSKDSLIVKKLRGLDPPRMPRNRPPLADDTIDRIAAWIDSGAKLDADRKASESLESIAWNEQRILSDKLGRMKAEERLDVARKEVERIYAAVRPASAVADASTVRISERFLAIGIENRARAEKLLESMEKATDQLHLILGDDTKSTEKSGRRFLVFVFEKPAEFAEFCRQNGFETPTSGRSAVGRSSSAWPLLAITVPKEVPNRTADTKDRRPTRSSKRKQPVEAVPNRVPGVESLAIEALVQAAFDAYPKAPSWLEAGLASSLGRTVAPGDASYDALIDEARSAGPARLTGDWPRRADEFLKDRLPHNVSRPFAFALIDWLRRTWSAEFPQFVRALTAGEPALDPTIRKLWNTDRATFVTTWTDSLMRGPTRKGR